MAESLDDIMIGFEMGLMEQEQVVSEFRGLVENDVSTTADRYEEFAKKLEHTASGGNAQIRSMMGGPDLKSRAGLIDVMVGKYQTASVDVKAKICDLALRPLLRDNFFFVRMVVAKMTNPYLIGDIIRKQPPTNPGADFYEADLLGSGDAADPDLLQFWLNKFGYNVFAATTVALQRDHEQNVSSVISNSESLFQDAAHVTAATHDLFAELRIIRSSKKSKDELTAQYRGGFVGKFAVMVQREAEQANWIPLSQEMLQPYAN